jgi:hypothetical protein
LRLISLGLLGAMALLVTELISCSRQRRARLR